MKGYLDFRVGMHKSHILARENYVTLMCKTLHLYEIGRIGRRLKAFKNKVLS